MQSFSLDHFCIFIEYHNLLLNMVKCVQMRHTLNEFMDELIGAQLLFSPLFITQTKKIVCYSLVLYKSLENLKKKKKIKQDFCSPGIYLRFIFQSPTFFHLSFYTKIISSYLPNKMNPPQQSQSYFCHFLLSPKVREAPFLQHIQHFGNFHTTSLVWFTTHCQLQKV